MRQQCWFLTKLLFSVYVTAQYDIYDRYDLYKYIDRDSHDDYIRFNKFVKYNCITILLTMINPSHSKQYYFSWISLSLIVCPESSLAINMNNLKDNINLSYNYILYIKSNKK